MPSKRRQSIFWSPSAVTVITKEDIRNSGANTVHDLLRRVPGMDVFDMKTYYPLLGARAVAGHFCNRVLLLIDGREELWELTGTAIWGAMSIDLEEVERIEVIRGPASTLYGTGAVGAVINIVTQAESPTVKREILVSGGETGSLRLVGQIRDWWDLGDGKLSGDLRMALDGRRGRSDFRDQPLEPRMHGIVRYRAGRELDLSLHGGITGGEGILYMDMGDLGFYDGLNYWVMARGKFALGSHAALWAQLYYMYAQTNLHYRSRLQTQGVWLADMPEMLWSTQTVDGQVHLDVQVVEGLDLLGGMHLRTNLLDCEDMIISDDDELRGAAFVQLQWHPWEPLQLTGGLRMDLSLDSELALSPRAAMVFRPWADHAFRVGYSSAFRKPSDFESRVHSDIQEFNLATPEVVDRLATQLGNGDLANEEVHAFEVGWRGRFLDGRLDANLELFFNLYRDLIVFEVDIPMRLAVPDIPKSILRYKNGSAIYALGGEAELSWHPDGPWTLWCNLGVRRVAYQESDEALPSEPQLRLNFGGGYAPDTGMFVDVAWHYVSDYQMPLRNPIDPLDDPRLFQLGESLVMFGRSGYRMATVTGLRLEAGLAARLPLGQPFREFAGVEAPYALRAWDVADFGGEVLESVLSLYLRGSF